MCLALEVVRSLFFRLCSIRISFVVWASRMRDVEYHAASLPFLRCVSSSARLSLRSPTGVFRRVPFALEFVHLTFSACGPSSFVSCGVASRIRCVEYFASSRRTCLRGVMFCARFSSLSAIYIFRHVSRSQMSPSSVLRLLNHLHSSCALFRIVSKESRTPQRRGVGAFDT